MNFKINSRIYILTIVFIVIIFILLCTYKNIENYVPYGKCINNNMFKQGYTSDKKRDPFLPVSCERNNQKGIYIRNCWNTKTDTEGWNSYLNWEKVIQKNAPGKEDWEPEKQIALSVVSPQYKNKEHNTKWEIIPVPGKDGKYYIKVLDAGYNDVIDIKSFSSRQEKKQVYLYAIDANINPIAKPNNNPPHEWQKDEKGRSLKFHYIDFIETNMNMSTYPHLRKYTWTTQDHNANDWETRRQWEFIRAERPGKTTDTEEGFFKIKNVGTDTYLFLINSVFHEEEPHFWPYRKPDDFPFTPIGGALFGVGGGRQAIGDNILGSNLDNLWYLEKVSDFDPQTTEEIIERQQSEFNSGVDMLKREKVNVADHMRACMAEESTFPDLCSFKASRDCEARGLPSEKCFDWVEENKGEILIKCEDKNNKCETWAAHDNKYCELPRSEIWMKSNCKSSCKVDGCPYEITPIRTDCSDHPDVDCEELAYAGECKGKYSKFMNNYCKKSCNKDICNDNSREIVIKTKKNNNDMDLCIDHQGANENKTPVHMWDCDRATQKGWFWGRRGSKGRELKNSNGYCLDHGAGNNNVHMIKCDTGAYVHENRQWEFDGQRLKIPEGIKSEETCLDLDKNNNYHMGQWPKLRKCDEEGQSTHDNRKWIIKDLAPPVDCVYGDWGEWSKCDCMGTGKKYKTREILKESENGGVKCDYTPAERYCRDDETQCCWDESKAPGRCESWKNSGFCNQNEVAAEKSCRLTCGKCYPGAEPVKVIPPPTTNTTPTFGPPSIMKNEGGIMINTQAGRN